MPTGTEVETKFELDAASFERLKNGADVRSQTDQLNVYYDRAWRLANHAATFRVRFSPGNAPVLTLKVPVSTDHGTRTVQEFEFEYHMGDEPLKTVNKQRGIEVDREPPAEIDVGRELPPAVTEILLALGVNRLEKLGWMRNHRYFLSVSEFDEQVALDQLVLPDGRTVYEAEIESPNLETHARFKLWMCSQAPEARQSPMSKFQRFRAALAGQLNGFNRP